MTIPLIELASSRLKARAIIDVDGAEYTYGDLLGNALSMASALLDDDIDLAERRIAFLVPRSFDYVVAQWGIWLAGGIAVPLCESHPARELAYVLKDTSADTIICRHHDRERIAALAQEYNLRIITVDQVEGRDTVSLPTLAPDRRAMILYTSGTTSRPKGVVSTHASITAQITSLIDAWAWDENDHILHVLPLHHIHGIINVLGCALWAGATCEMFGAFDASRVLKRFARGDLTLFMAVPTIYSKLIAAFEAKDAETRVQVTEGCRRMRLMVSGSAALPVPVLERWVGISGHTLLERYGMSEIGMALSNPYRGKRRPGFVGVPLPGMSVRLFDEQNDTPIDDEDVAGEIRVRGDAVFSEYWQRPEATAAAFREGWFCTGDIAKIESGAFRLLGRNSVDIIKSGGYKISALEIEAVLREHPKIAECAIVGVADEQWGERVAAAIVLHDDQGGALDLESLRGWTSQRLARYKVPTRLRVLESLPRNVMGKVTKPAIKTLFQSDCDTIS